MIGLIIVCYFCVALPCSVWMGVARVAFERLKIDSKTPVKTAFEYLILRDRARMVGSLCALGIAVSTLPLGAWRRFYLVAAPGAAPSFPAEFVMLFGLFWSFQLAVAFLSVYPSIRATGEGLLDVLAPPEPDSVDTISQWQSRRKSVMDFLGLETQAFESFRIIFAILAPLLSAVLASLTQGKG